MPRGPINRAVTSREPLAIQYGRPILTHCERTFIAGVPNGTTRSLLPLPITRTVLLARSILDRFKPVSSEIRIPDEYRTSRTAQSLSIRISCGFSRHRNATVSKTELICSWLRTAGRCRSRLGVLIPRVGFSVMSSSS